MFPTNRLLLRTAVFSTAALVLFTAHAQSSGVRVKVKADLETEPDRGTGISKMVYGDEGSIVALKTKNGTTVIGGVSDSDLDWSLYVYGSDKLNVIKHDKPKFVWGVGPVTLETIETFGKNFHVILSKPDPDNGKLLLLDQILSPRSLTGKAAAMITEVTYDRFGKGVDYFKPGMAVGFTTSIAADGKHMLIGLTPAGTVRSAGCPIVGVMVDEKMQPKWTNTLSPASGTFRTDVISVAVDKIGAAWYLVKNVTDAAPKTKGQLGFTFSLYRMDSVGQQEAKLDLGEKVLPQEATFSLMPDGRIVCTGTYTDKDANRDESIGVFHTVLDMASLKWSKAATTPFIMREVKKVERLQNNMHVMQAWPKTGGGLYVLAEKAGVESHTVSDLSGKKVEKTEWVDGALHIMELGKDGAMKWYTQVPREMSFANNGPGKAFSWMKDDVLFVFFNDAEGNTELRKKKVAVEPVDKPQDALMLEFKDGGGYKEKTVLKEGFKQGYFNADALWPMGDGLVGTTGAPDFRKDRTFPIVIEFGSDKRK
ncbi:MAG: hypothetical protein IPN44_02180 [Flavobacteriales bacterium]|nr:hypothetical protein [Flavobacteriales bacterium]